MASNAYEVSFTSDTYRVKQVVTSLMAFIRDHFPALSKEDAGDLKLIFSELLFNATIHGNHGDHGKSVRVRVEIDEEAIYSVITDEGIGFDYMNLISTFNEEANLSSEHGRGIRIVYSLTDSLAFNVRGNEIKFYKRVTPNG